MKRKCMSALSRAIFALAGMAFAYLPLSADTIKMSATDASGTSSFVDGQNFGGPPSPEHDYVVPRVNGINYMLRTPAFTATEPTNIVFKGRSLTIGEDNGTPSRDCVFGIATVYANEAQKATITVDDLRVYGRNIISQLVNGKACLAGKITIYGTETTYASQFRLTQSNSIFEIASTITGEDDKAITFTYSRPDSEYRVTGDMSSYFGKVTFATATSGNTDYSGGRLVLACPYAVKSTTIADGNYLTLGPNFSYKGSGADNAFEIPAGSRFAAAYDAGTGTTAPVVLTSHFSLPATGGFELALDAASLPALDLYAGKVLPIIKIPRALREVTEADFTDVTSGLSIEYGLPSRVVQVEVDGEGMQTVSLVTYPYVNLEAASKSEANTKTSDGYVGLKCPQRAFLAPRQFWPGERVAFLGDSITHAAKYTSYLQMALAKRYRENPPIIVNCGRNGDRASGVVKSGRLDWDVLASRPDRVFVMLGMNDVSRDKWKSVEPESKEVAAAREEALRSYSTRMREIAVRLKEAGRSVVLMTPSPYDQYGTFDDKAFLGCNEPGLARCAEIVRKLALEMDLPLVEIHRPMTELLKKGTYDRLCGKDRVHPQEVGHSLIAAFVMGACGEAEGPPVEVARRLRNDQCAPVAMRHAAATRELRNVASVRATRDKSAPLEANVAGILSELLAAAAPSDAERNDSAAMNATEASAEVCEKGGGWIRSAD